MSVEIWASRRWIMLSLKPFLFFEKDILQRRKKWPSSFIRKHQAHFQIKEYSRGIEHTLDESQTQFLWKKITRRPYCNISLHALIFLKKQILVVVYMDLWMGPYFLNINRNLRAISAANTGMTQILFNAWMNFI